MIFDIELYNEDFFAWHKKYAHDYSISTMDWYMEKYKPKSVIDFGCGIGSYLESAYNHDARIVGVEIAKDKAIGFMNKIIAPFVLKKDICEPYMYGKFDCVISIEVAEHIEPSGTNDYITNLVNCGGTILFTSATEDQGGCGHINCKPREEWIELFEAKGVKYNKELTDEISLAWKEAPAYIQKNLIVFI